MVSKKADLGDEVYGGRHKGNADTTHNIKMQGSEDCDLLNFNTGFKVEAPRRKFVEEKPREREE